MKPQFFQRNWFVLFFLMSFLLAGCQSIPDSLGNTFVKTPIQGFSIQEIPHIGHINGQTRVLQYLLSNHISGNVLVVKDHKIIFNEGVGYANISTKAPNKPTTTYPIASITKSMVATSIMQLQEKGKLSIYDPVSKYLPHFPNGKNIKLIHLLSHTSGIRPPLSYNGVTTLVGLIKRIEQRPVQFQPGTWKYRDENYAILAYILEKVSGQPLHTYIKENIFAKAGMKESGFIIQNQPVPLTSVGYIQQNNQFTSSGISRTSFLMGFGDIYSTAYDLYLYDHALMNGKLVTKKSLKEMLIPRSKSNYGIGLYNVGFAVQSRGVLGGYECFHAIFNDKTYVSILLNVRGERKDIHLMSREIHNIVAKPT